LDLLILAVGRCREPAIAALVDEYRRRCAWVVRVREVAIKGAAAPGRQQVESESLQLLAAVPEGAVIVALDERGQDLSSGAFAQRLGRWRDDGERAVAFLIGGADGLSPAARDRADLLLAFGRMTWPHMLARVMLAEQLYRATTILAGHPYHRA
jgi:23S rRNA (pseudouridine1915-N3)-methyltransferase